MNHFVREGIWWLPETPSHRVPGTLSFDGDGINLTAHGVLQPASPNTDGTFSVGSNWVLHPLVYGRLHDFDLATLLDVGGYPFNVPGDGVQETYGVTFALTGCHVATNRFSRARVRFDTLDVWLDPPAIEAPSPARSWPEDKSLAIARVSGADIELLAGVRGTASDDSVHVDRDVHFTLDMETPLSALEIRDRFVKPLGDLLAVTLGRVARVDGWWLLGEEGDPRSDWGETTFNALAPHPGREVTRAQIKSYTAPTLLTGDDVRSLGEFIEAWFATWQRHRDAIVLLLAPYYAPFIYSEHRFASIFQAAEALHKSLGLPTRELPKSEHRERVCTIVTALEGVDLSEDDRTWAQRVLSSRNDRTLVQKVDDLLATAGDIGRVISTNHPEFAQTVASGRAGVSHGGGSRRLNRVERHHYGDLLRFLVRALLLCEAGIALEHIERRALGAAAFQRALRAALEARDDPAPSAG